MSEQDKRELGLITESSGQWAAKPSGPTSEVRLERARKHIQSMLVPGEFLMECAAQRRLFALTHRRGVVSASSGRFIAITRGLLGGYKPIDIRWQDVKQAKIEVGIFGSTLTLQALRSPDLAITGELEVFRFSGLRKDEAQAVYRICQAQEQAWREKRRLRELEELRASSGGMQLSTDRYHDWGSGMPTLIARSASTDEASDGDRAKGMASQDAQSFSTVAARLAQAKALVEQGLVNDSEYETIKARILSEL